MSRLAPVLFSALLLSTLAPALALTEKEINRALARLYAQGYVHDRDAAESVRAAILAYQRDWQLPDDGVLDEELFARLEGEHPETMPREQWTEDARCVFHNKLPSPRVTVSFDGDCPNGHAQGKGTETWRFMLLGDWVESTASGTFVDGELSGTGTYRWASGQVYEGDFVHGARTGYWITHFPNGDIYEGNFVDGERNGHGIYRWASGSVYEGDFVDGVRDGQGTYRWASGNVYEGDFVDGAQTGHGILHCTNGAVIEGYWIDGVLQD